jgi:allantoinase
MTGRLTYPHRRRGLDHNWFDFEPTIQRPRMSWPGGKRIALWITVPVELFPLDAPSQPFRPLGSMTLGYPDLWNRSSRDYGLRLGMKATAAVNSEIAKKYPRIIDEIAKRNWEFMANGVDMGHVHYAGIALEDERRLIREARTTLTQASARPVSGWHSPGRSHSPNTYALLAEQGVTYVTDWANDDMPYMVTTSSGQLCAMPQAYELSDRHLLVQNNLTVEDYVEQNLQAFDQLSSEAERYNSGRVFSLSVTPWILGYPHRIAALRRLLTHMLDGTSVWPATGTEIVAAFNSASGHLVDR